MTDVLALLKQADPVDVTELRAQLPPRDQLAAILASGAGGSRGPRRRPRQLARLLVSAAGLAAVVTVALLLVAGGEGRNVDTAAAAALEAIADTAREQPPTLPHGDHRFLYFELESKGFLVMADEAPFGRVRTRDDFGFLLEFESTQEVWVGERRGLVRNAGGAPTFASPGDRRAWEAAGSPKLPWEEAYVHESPSDTGIERLQLPTDPEALLDRLQERAADSGHGNAYVFTTLITDYLREWGVTPEQRAALFEAAARLPGIDLLGRQADPEGRPGIGFAMADEEGHHRYTLILDPDTGELLAELNETLPGGPIPPGARGHTVHHPPELVDAIGERPS
jgi:hypothetical protein